MKWLESLKDNKKFKLVVMIVIGLWSFYFLMNMFFVMGELYVCNNMNGTLVEDSNGLRICLDVVAWNECNSPDDFDLFGNKKFNDSFIIK